MNHGYAMCNDFKNYGYEMCNDFKNYRYGICKTSTLRHFSLYTDMESGLGLPSLCYVYFKGIKQISD